jgi:hypothetical protein
MESFVSNLRDDTDTNTIQYNHAVSTAATTAATVSPTHDMLNATIEFEKVEEEHSYDAWTTLILNVTIIGWCVTRHA